MVALNRIWGVTGPRLHSLPYVFTDAQLVEVQRIMQELCYEAFAEHKPSQVNTRLALGFDQAAARAALALHIPFVYHSMGPDQAERWSRHDQGVLRQLARQASRTEEIAERMADVDPTPRIAICNRALVIGSESMLALNLGTKGTKQTLDIAKRRNIPVLDLGEKFKQRYLEQVGAFTHRTQPAQRSTSVGGYFD